MQQSAEFGLLVNYNIEENAYIDTYTRREGKIEGVNPFI